MANAAGVPLSAAPVLLDLGGAAAVLAVRLVAQPSPARLSLP